MHLMMLNLFFLLLFSVNIQIAFLGNNTGIFDISWSVCVEEQFYLVWPLLINTFRKKLSVLLVGMFLMSVASRLFFCIYMPGHSSDWPMERAWSSNYVLIFDKLDLFGGGLIIALIYYKKDDYEKLLRNLFHPGIQSLVLTLTLMYTLSIIRPEGTLLLIFIDHYICIFLFGYTLLSAVMENSILKLENPLLKALGRISFGIYLFHTAVCQLVLVFFKKFIQHPESHLIYDVAYPLINLVLTCIIAYLSYEFYEKRFLRLKNKYALVATRI